MDTQWRSRHRQLLRTDGRCSVMAIVNVTPDSFSDGSRHLGPRHAIAHTLACLEAGADLVDIGGESTRPFAEAVPTEEEWGRIGPVLDQVGRIRPDAIVSVDTRKPEIARRALALGAVIVNDVSGCDPDDSMADVVAEAGAAIVIMHMQGTPATMQVDPHYEDVVSEVCDFLADRIRLARSRGIPGHSIAVDPGVGFGKTLAHNLLLLRNMDRIRKLGCPVLIGTSRKRMIGEITGRAVGERVAGSVASALYAAHHGADVVRVHDVGETVDALKVWNALEIGDGG